MIIYKNIDILNISYTNLNTNKTIKKIPKLHIKFIECNKKKINNLINTLKKTEINLKNNNEIIQNKSLYSKINNNLNLNNCINSIILIIDNEFYLDDIICNNFNYIFINNNDDIVKINNFNINDSLHKYDYIVMTFKCFNCFITMNNMVYKSAIFYRLNINDIMKKIKTYNIVYNYILFNAYDIYFHSQKNNNIYDNNFIKLFINDGTYNYINKIKINKHKIIKKKTYIYKIKPNFIKEILEKKTNIHINEKFIANIAYYTCDNFIMYLYRYIYDNLKIYIHLSNILQNSYKIFNNKDILFDNDYDFYIFSNKLNKNINIIIANIKNNILHISIDQYNRYFITLNLYINNCVEILLKLKKLLTINVINNKCSICNCDITSSYNYTNDINCICVNSCTKNIELFKNKFKKIKPFKNYNVTHITNYINCLPFELLLIIIKNNNFIIIIYKYLTLVEYNIIKSYVKKNIQTLEYKKYNIKKKYKYNNVVFYNCVDLNIKKYDFPELYNNNKKSKFYFIN